MSAKFFIGPMSKNIVDSIIEFTNITNNKNKYIENKKIEDMIYDTPIVQNKYSIMNQIYLLKYLAQNEEKIKLKQTKLKKFSKLYD